MFCIWLSFVKSKCSAVTMVTMERKQKQNKRTCTLICFLCKQPKHLSVNLHISHKIIVVIVMTKRRKKALNGSNKTWRKLIQHAGQRKSWLRSQMGRAALCPCGLKLSRFTHNPQWVRLPDFWVKNFHFIQVLFSRLTQSRPTCVWLDHSVCRVVLWRPQRSVREH